jgi:hypothetical protein
LIAILADRNGIANLACSPLVCLEDPVTAFVVEYVGELPASLGPRGGLDVVGTIIQRDKGQFLAQRKERW